MIKEELTYNDLDENQKEIVNAIVKTDKNLFIQGRAGTGKSAIIKIAEKLCKEKEKNIILLSYTGLAAQNIGGTTIHSQFKIGPAHIYKKENYKVYDEVLKTVDAIIIDEVSMITPDLFELIEHLCRIAKADADEENGKKPFGGTQIILVGDLYQLGPFHKVNDSNINKAKQKEEIEEYLKSFNDEKYKISEDKYEEPFFFNSPVYEKTNFETKILTEVYRQDKKEKKFLEALYCISRNKQIEESLDFINRHCYDPAFEPDDDTVIIATLNKTVDDENDKAKLGKKIYTYPKPTGWIDEANIKELVKLSGFSERRLRSIPNPEPFDKTLELFVGAKVMFVKNNSTEGYENGVMGIITGFVDAPEVDVNSVFKKIPKVKILTKTKKNYRKEILVHPVTIQNEMYFYDERLKQINKKIIGRIRQIPLVLAYALTVNKSQGQTLDSVYIRPEGEFFGYGQLYVALSRVKSIKNLHLKRKIEIEDVKVSKRVKDFLGPDSEEYKQVDFSSDDYIDVETNNVTENCLLEDRLDKLERIAEQLLSEIRILKSEMINTQNEISDDYVAEDEEQNYDVDSQDVVNTDENLCPEEPDSSKSDFTQDTDECEIEYNDIGSLNAEIERIFNKYDISSKLSGCYCELQDSAERKKIKNIFSKRRRENEYLTSEDIIKIDAIYKNNKIENRSDIIKARLFIPDKQDRERVLSLLGKRDKKNIDNTKRLLIVNRENLNEIEYNRLKDNYEKWIAYSENIKNIIFAYFVSRLQNRTDLATRQDVYNVCQQPGELYVNQKDFNECFDKISSGKGGKRLFVLSFDEANNVFIDLDPYVKSEITKMFKVGMFELNDRDNYFDTEEYEFINIENFYDEFLENKIEMVIGTDKVKRLKLMRFLELFPSENCDSYRLVSTFFKIKEKYPDAPEREVSKGDFKEYIDDENELNRMLLNNTHLISKVASFYRLNTQRAEQIKRYKNLGYFDGNFDWNINITMETIVKNYFVPALKKLKKQEIQRLKDADFNIVDFGFSPVLYNTKPQDIRTCVAVLRDGEVCYVPLNFGGEEYKDRLIKWLKDKKYM